MIAQAPRAVGGARKPRTAGSRFHGGIMNPRVHKTQPGSSDRRETKESASPPNQPGDETPRDGRVGVPFVGGLFPARER